MTNNKNKLGGLFLAILVMMVSLSSCNDTETYAEKKDKERDAINAYMQKINAKIITEEEFRNNGYVTDTLKQEWVLLQKSSVYMQVINRGTFYNQETLEKTGEKVELDKRMKDGQTSSILCRFIETNLMTTQIILTNITRDALAIPETMTVYRSSDTYVGSFISGQSLMYASYGSLSVPSGWLVPLAYLNIGRCGTKYDEIAKIRLIVPHSQGQASATQNVYPCLYEISYQAGK